MAKKANKPVELTPSNVFVVLGKAAKEGLVYPDDEARQLARYCACLSLAAARTSSSIALVNNLDPENLAILVTNAAKVGYLLGRGKLPLISNPAPACFSMKDAGHA